MCKLFLTKIKDYLADNNLGIGVIVGIVGLLCAFFAGLYMINSMNSIVNGFGI